MVKHTIATKSLSRFIQIFDGSFPSGAFVHSFGLEPHIVLEKVTTIEELKQYLHNLINYQYIGLDFVLVDKVYSYLENNKLNLVIKEDRKYSTMLSYEFAKASSDLGENYLKQINFDIQKEIVKNYFKAIKEGVAKGNELVVLASYAFELEIDIDTFLALWCKKNIINIAMASLKISRIKPSDIQKMLFEFDDELESLIEKREKKINSFNPLFEEVIYQHKRLEPKLFVT
jgi:urease accessory protein